MSVAGNTTADVDLRMGPRLPSHRTIMEVLAEETGSLYLRGSAFGSYTGISWDRLPEEAFAGCPEPEAGLLVQSHTLEDSQTLSIRSRTYSARDLHPYYLSQLPEVGVPRQDSGSRIGGRTTAYSISYGTLLQSPQQRRCPTGLHHDRRLHPFFSSLQRVRPLYSGRGSLHRPPGGQPPRPCGTSPKTPGSPTFSGGFAPSRGGFCPGFRSV